MPHPVPVPEDALLAEIMGKIQFRLVGPGTPGSMNSTLDPQENVRGLDLANTQFSEATPLMSVDFLMMPRMSTIAMAYIINGLVNKMPADHMYLNIGVWCGWPFLAGIIGNADKKCVGVDNFSEFPELPSEQIFDRHYHIFRSVLSEFYKCDYRDYFRQFHKGKIGIYFYDGDHHYEHQMAALQIADPFMAEGAYILVDDTNSYTAYDASVDFVNQNQGKYAIVFDQKTANNSHPTFWNGLMILKKL